MLKQTMAALAAAGALEALAMADLTKPEFGGDRPSRMPGVRRVTLFADEMS